MSIRTVIGTSTRGANPHRPFAAVAGGLLTALLIALLTSCTSSTGGADAGTPPAPNAGGPATATPHAAASSRLDWPAYHGNRARTGRSTTMPTVHHVALAARLKLDGQVYASPIVARGLTIVATENDTVYALDAADHQVWRRHLATPSPQSQRPCGDIDPLGITGTPVYRDNGVVYVAAELSGSPPTHVLYALRVGTGAVLWHRHLDLPGVDSAAMQERGALTLAGGRVWVPFGGLAGDCGSYKGRVVGYAVDGRGQPIAYTVPTAREAGIWTPPGPSVDSASHLYVAVGNGESGVGDRYDHSDSVLEISTGAKLLDSYSPKSWPTDNDNDLDLGSQGPALVGPWVFSAGKSGNAYVLRRGHLGGVGGQVSTRKICTSFGGTAVVGNVVYVPCTDGLRAVGIDGQGAMHVRWHASGSITGSPVVGGGRIWSLDTDSGVLHALDPRTGRSLATVTVGSCSRFATPALSGRRVLVGTLSGLTVVRTS